MKREDIEKLLGGYATGTLTDQERRALFDAALADQALFDALAGEEALREVLDDPRCRRQIEQALREQPAGLLERAAGMIRRPRAWALAGTLAATAAIAFVVVRVNHQPQARFQLAQHREVEAPAPVSTPPPRAESERRAAVTAPARPKLPAPEEKRHTAPEKKEAAPGGVVGGVIGGIVTSPPAAVPAQPRVLAESRVPVPPPPQPPPPAAVADASKDVSAVAAGPGPVQFQANRLEKSRTRSLSAAARQDASAAPVTPVRYEVLLKGANGQFTEADRRLPVAPGTPVRLVLTPDQEGNLSVFDSAHRLLFSTPAVAGGRYIVDPPPAESKFTVVLSPAAATAKTSVSTALRESVEEGKLPGGRIVAVIDLSRPQN